MQVQDHHGMRGDSDAWQAQARTGALGIALMFGFAATLMALILPPVAEHMFGLVGFERTDRTITGSIGGERVYTIRRSVLQPTPESVCVIRANGTRSGQC
jgi:hypothetical protein